MKLNPPRKVRAALYVLTGVLSPIIGVLTLPEVGILPSWVMLIWTGEMTFIGTMAALNTSK